MDGDGLRIGSVPANVVNIGSRDYVIPDGERVAIFAIPVEDDFGWPQGEPITIMGPPQHGVPTSLVETDTDPPSFPVSCRIPNLP